MDEFLSLVQYKNVTDLAKEKGSRLSNCVLLAENVRQKILQHELFYVKQNNNILILDDQGKFYRCYYYLNQNDNYGVLSFDKPVVIELPYTKRLNEKQKLQVKLIQSMGFYLGRKSGTMFCLPQNIIQHENGNKVICTFANEDDLKEVDILLRTYFNPLFSFLPTEEELINSIIDKRVFIVRDGNKIAALLISGIEKQYVSIKQLVVDKIYRRQGLGKALIDAYHANYVNEVALFQHWVDMSNKVAIGMYRDFGYEFNIRKANEYILLPKERR